MGLAPKLIFALYIYLGNELDIASTVFLMDQLQKFTSSLSSAMWQYRTKTDLDTTFSRVQDFFNLYENQTGLIASVADSEFAITVKGDFSWGFEQLRVKKDSAAIDLSTHLVNTATSFI